MPTTLKIRVNTDVLEKTRNCVSEHGKNCAIAVAVRDLLPHADVGAEYIYPFFYENTITTNMLHGIKMPKEATNFIEKFDSFSSDQRRCMPELEFEISIPDEVIEKINIDEIRPLLVNHPTLELVEE